MWGMMGMPLGNGSGSMEPLKQEYIIKEVSFKGHCGFHDGYDRDCFDDGVYSLDSIILCMKHLHIRMRAITLIALKTNKSIILTYRIN